MVLVPMVAWRCTGLGRSLQSQTFTSSGTFNVPANVSAVWISGCGAGGGGNGYVGGTGNPSHGGGGAGEFCLGRLIPVTPGGTLSISIGIGGPGSPDNSPMVAAGSTQYGTFNLQGSKAARTGASYGGDGGGVYGGISNAYFPPVAGVNFGNRESISGWGGPAGPVHSVSGGPPGVGQQIICAGAAGTGGGNTGTGGSASVWPGGGNGSPTSGIPAPSAGTGWGAGGGGAAQGPSATGGRGSDGAIVVHWVG